MRKWILILTLIIGVPASIIHNYHKNQDITALLDHGKTAKAQIQKVEWRKRSSNYRLLINFSTDTNKIIDSKIDVGSDIGKSVVDGNLRSVDVKYLPEHPETVCLADIKGTSNDLYYGSAATFVIGVVFLIFDLRRR